LKSASVRESAKSRAVNQAIGSPVHGDVAGRDEIQLRSAGSGATQIGRVGGNVTILNVTLNFASGGAARATKQVKMAQCFRTEQQPDILALIREIAAHMTKPPTPNSTKRPRKTAVK
jgi:hypothetical protein